MNLSTARKIKLFKSNGEQADLLKLMKKLGTERQCEWFCASFNKQGQYCGVGQILLEKGFAYNKDGEEVSGASKAVFSMHIRKKLEAMVELGRISRKEDGQKVVFQVKRRS